MEATFSNSTAHSRAGRLWLTAMGLFLMLAGLTFTWVLWHAWQRAEETRRWTETPCRILTSRVVSERPTPHSPIAYRAEVKYHYQFHGANYTGSNIRRVDGVTQHEERAREIQERYVPGAETLCHVNPARPSQAVLQHDTRAALYSIWFPLLFVAGGAGMAWRALVVRPKGSSETPAQ